MIIKITVDGKDIYSQKGWTILKALSYLKIDIPNLCDFRFNNINNAENKNLSFITEENKLNCKLCIVKIKRKNEDSYSFKYACNEIVENGMNIISEDEEIISYRKSLLNSISYSHDKSSKLYLLLISFQPIINVFNSVFLFTNNSDWL